jgi:DNA-binding transcriptional MerR regulator
MTMLDPSAIELPQIPGKRYFTIGEVSELCAVKPHVLRYWEQEFPQLRPIKRRGNRRYYQRHEVELIREIRRLLYLDGYTIGGARNQLQKPATMGEVDPSPRPIPKDYRGIIDELQKISVLLEG